MSIQSQRRVAIGVNDLNAQDSFKFDTGALQFRQCVVERCCGIDQVPIVIRDQNYEFSSLRPHERLVRVDCKMQRRPTVRNCSRFR